MFAGVLALVLAVPGRASPEDDMEWAKEQLQGQLTYIRQLVETRGTPPVKVAWSQVRLEIEDSPLPNPRVGRSGPNSHLRIALPNSFFLELTYFVELNIILSSHPELAQCATEYQNYVYEKLAGNRTQQLRQATFTAVQPPEIFAQGHSGCQGLLALYPFPEQAKEFRARQVFNAILFTVFHELGHVALDHQPINDALLLQATTAEERKEVFLGEMLRSRDQEYEADQWAARNLMQMGANPLEIVSPALLQMLLASSGVDTSYEPIDTHPVALNRFHKIIGEVENSFQELNNMALPQQLQQIFDAYQALADQAVESFAEINAGHGSDAN